MKEAPLEEEKLSVVQLQSAELRPPLDLYTVVGADVVPGLPAELFPNYARNVSRRIFHPSPKLHPV